MCVGRRTASSALPSFNQNLRRNNRTPFHFEVYNHQDMQSWAIPSDYVVLQVKEMRGRVDGVGLCSADICFFESHDYCSYLTTSRYKPSYPSYLFPGAIGGLDFKPLCMFLTFFILTKSTFINHGACIGRLASSIIEAFITSAALRCFMPGLPLLLGSRNATIRQHHRAIGWG
jgi:hypothetical protein